MTRWSEWEAWTNCNCWEGDIGCSRTFRKRTRQCLNKSKAKNCSCGDNNIDMELNCKLP